MGVGDGEPLLGLVGRQVGGDRAGPAGGGQVPGEGVRPVAARSGSSTSSPRPGCRSRPPPRRRRRRPGCARPRCQRPGAGALDGDPVHHRVAVGHARPRPGRRRSELALAGQRPDGGQRGRPRRGSRRAGSRPAPRDRLARTSANSRPGRARDRRLTAPSPAPVEWPPIQVDRSERRPCRPEPGLRPVPEVSRSNHLMAVSTSLSPRPDRLTRISGGVPSAPERQPPAELERAGQRVRRLDGRHDALGPGQQGERLHRLGVGDRPRSGPAGRRPARSARARHRGSPDRPRSSATPGSGRPRPAARRSACRAAPRPTRRRWWRRAGRSPPRRRRPRSRTGRPRRRGMKSAKMPSALEPPPTQAATASGSRP